MRRAAPALAGEGRMLLEEGVREGERAPDADGLARRRRPRRRPGEQESERGEAKTADLGRADHRRSLRDEGQITGRGRTVETRERFVNGVAPSQPRHGTIPCVWAECANTSRLLKKAQMRGGARRQHARRSLSTLSVRPRAPTKQMDLFEQPGGGRQWH